MKEYPINKNDKITVEIIDLTHEGLGIAKIDHYPIFIENSLPGEIVDILIVKVGNKFAFGKVIEWQKISPERRDLKNYVLLQTGIAPLQHMSYGEQLLFKQKQVKNVMKKIAKLPDTPVLPTIGMAVPKGYRNKAQIPARKVDNQLETGFFRKNSHELIPIQDFYIQDPKIDQAILVIRDILRRFQVKPYNEQEHTGNLRQIIIRRGHYSHEMMVILVTRTKKLFNHEQLVKEIMQKLPETISIIQNINPDKTNVIMGEESILLYGNPYINDQLLGKNYHISAASFYQVNTEQTEYLYKTAIEFAGLSPTDQVVDAYCGIGTIALSLAEQVKHVYGVEIIEAAILDARENAAINQIENCTFNIGKAEEVMIDWQKAGISPNIIFVDPPRKGLTESFIETCTEMDPNRIIYISCNPATLARDLKLFAELGYETRKIQPVDLFPQTYHVETVALLQKIDHLSG
ncbi:23S rRNA (uracil(1939)-C(5))-methyltransferase RlmD [Melissococcus plutonius]|uniref:RNA methyltransferase, TrmA family n=1 Tax=Melissococcus plutonius (strain ATCC 35311 / DSM 29964 / CIP 104052 / LMG 20360 / NCIMB 702443) TaxID=940190 RepID=F3Y9F6_MELPT|nr:23S rRNA (uracil(1939)-C(5))-methyltransferase RlmD [Melissococcus plutonius]AIM24690.1 RNA methyltransferase, TrmA family [Melissococcus plutonius S1]KMT24794.1 RNA methyltransferase, TrmA family [Melissococcus plutonius]KMT26431.1 RNA methyltransferase, TrmA family [Melissococcus plutonius]KMT27681.1 RNA methyltransferase, TrmA family [Melissococcus plutonius]KMT29453.1 RNA methyltransferase, TrmA family [Melissococcus plutonius]